MEDHLSSSAPDQDADGPQHDPYARRPGYVTGVDGRTDTWTTAVVAGVVAGVVVSFVAGLLDVAAPVTFSAAAVVGAAVWFAVRTRRRAADRRAGRDPDSVSKARSQAVADANGGRRFFVAQNPVVVIVMGGVFLALGIARLVAGGASADSVIVMVLLTASGAVLVVQGIGTLVARRRSPSSSGRPHD